MAKSKKMKSPSWHDSGIKILEAYLKKSKSPKGRLMVFSTGGDLILICSKTLTDTTSIGSILAAMNTATTGLNALLKTKVSLIRFGESDKELWMLPYQNQWIIAGAHVPLKQALLKPLMSHLKIASRSAKAGRETEALEGMNETTIDTAIAQVIDR